MVRASKLFAYILFFILVLVYFMPKESIYFLAEKKLEKYNVVISKEVISDNGFSLKLKNGKIFYNSIESAIVDSMKIKVFLLYNSVNIQNVYLSSMASSFVPLHIDSINIRYSVFNPLNIVLSANGEFGEATGKIGVLDKNISIVLTPSELMLKKYKNTLSGLKNKENGEYEYDQTF